MSDILEQVGITKDELIDRIVEKALGITADYRNTGEETWDNIPLSEVVDKKITTAIGNLIDTMKPMIEGRINKIMGDEMEKVFTSPFQPVTQWNEPKGEPTTIRDMIAKEAANYWTTKVDNNGNANNGYGSREERAIWFARKVMTEYYDKELASTVRKMAEELKARIPATIASEISEAVIKHLR